MTGLLRGTALLGAAATFGCALLRPAAPSPQRRALALTIDSLIGDSRFRTARWGILIVDAERGDTLYSHNAGELFVPASNQKLLTGAVALDVLGPGYRYATQIGAGGPVVEGVLRGDLIVRGTGDPSVSDRMRGDAMIPLRAMADSLGARGIRHIAGRVSAAGDPFPGASLGFGWAWDDLDFPYSAGVDELLFNEGFARVRVRAGVSAGAPASAVVGPARTYPAVKMRAVTVAAGDSGSRGGRRLRVLHDSAALGTVLLEGTIAAGDSAELRIAFRDQRLAYLTALQEALAERGITLGDTTASAAQSAAAPRAEDAGGGALREPLDLPLFAWTSDSLGVILTAFQKPSQNQIGEILLRTLGLVRGTAGTPAEGARVVTERLLAWGAAPGDFRVRDGSGLSRHNVVSPEALVRVLDAMRRSAHFSVFRDALPIAGIDGTIAARMRGTAAAGNLRAKTGTLDMVRSLSGYVMSMDGHLLLFSILCNNWLVDVREIDAVQDAIGVRLAAMRVGER
ncbi:MAG: D-alanyl-D-alanine carboxypeptidase/D-alanyl-D-alanine endopeptidase [Gemmatimonadaceae bacterium]